MEKPYIIGIAGGSGSGKSTLSDSLKKALCNYRVFEMHMDSYFKDETKLPRVYVPEAGKEYPDYNHPDSFYLEKLKSDLDMLITRHDYQIIIVEGLLTLWDLNIFNLLDLKIYVDLRDDERIVRRLKRNMRWGLSFDEISDVYLNLVRYRHDEFVEPTKWRADYIVNGKASLDKPIDIIVSYVDAVIK